MRLGGKDDIPLDEVMIYISNIPFSRENNILN
jgi:hypothetical protein